ncbi:MAG: hypothetical protein Q9175_007840 [Cornicularia normoerica]
MTARRDLPPFLSPRSISAANFVRMNGINVHVNILQPFVPIEDEMPSPEERLHLHWDIPQPREKIQARPIDMKHLAPERPPHSEHELDFDFADTFDDNLNPYKCRYSPKEDEAYAKWNSMNPYANSRTPLISKMGYRIMLGSRRHFGYYLEYKSWPFPVTKALQAMEDCLMDSLNIQNGGNFVLDVGAAKATAQCT